MRIMRHAAWHQSPGVSITFPNIRPPNIGLQPTAAEAMTSRRG